MKECCSLSPFFDVLYNIVWAVSIQSFPLHGHMTLHTLGGARWTNKLILKYKEKVEYLRDLYYDSCVDRSFRLTKFSIHCCLFFNQIYKERKKKVIVGRYSIKKKKKKKLLSKVKLKMTFYLDFCFCLKGAHYYHFLVRMHPSWAIAMNIK